MKVFEVIKVKESVSAGGMGAASVASSFANGGNGFVNGGPGTVKRVSTKPKKKKKNTKTA
jgi:hypothetical protein